MILGQEFTWRTISQEICVGHTRQQIFASKIISYLAAFNIMAIVYPVAGCIREYGKFGIGDIGFFFYNVVKAVVYSFVLNSAVFLIAAIGSGIVQRQLRLRRVVPLLLACILDMV